MKRRLANNEMESIHLGFTRTRRFVSRNNPASKFSNGSVLLFVKETRRLRNSLCNLGSNRTEMLMSLS